MSSQSLNSKSRSIVQQQSSQQASHHPQQSCINQTNSQQLLQRLRQSIQLSKQELIALTNKNQFSEKVFCFNNEAKKLIQANKIQEALIYLNEAEKILEYAASSGKNIQRKSIVEVLHNQACCYQILWDLEKCSNYIEALIFNFNSELKFGDIQSVNPSEIHLSSQNPSQIHMGSSKKIHLSSSKKSLPVQSRIQSLKLQKKIQLAKYYLLYCAINSQLKNNQGALIAATKASQLTKSVLTEILQTYQQNLQSNPQSVQSLPMFVHTMLQQIPLLATSVNPNKLQDLFSLVRHYIKIYNSKCLFNNLSTSKNMHASQRTKDVYQKYKNFSIGNIMQLTPVGDSSQSSKDLESIQHEEVIRYDKLIEKLIVFSICHFTMATELRYIALNNAKNDKQGSQLLLEFKQSQTFHLMSILIVAMYMPFDIIYMEHIISSYHGHYKAVLLSNGLDGTPQLNEDEIRRIKETVIYFQKDSNLTSSSSRKQQDQKKCSTTNQSNNSLIVSFHQEEQQSNNHSYEKSCKNSSKKTPSKNTQNIEFNKMQTMTYQDPEVQNQKHLFDQYYYVKKNTQPDHEQNLRYQENITQVKKKPSGRKSVSKNKKLAGLKSLKKQTSSKASKSKSKINTQESIEQNQNKISSKKSKTKHFDHFESKLSTILHHTSRQPEKTKPNSQGSSQIVHSPFNMAPIYSKITSKTKPNKSKSKEISKRSELVNVIDHTKHQSEYFNKCNFVAKKPQIKAKKQVDENNRPIQKKKSKSTKKQPLMNIKSQDPIKIEYFHIHNPNIMRETKSPTYKKSTVGNPSKNPISKSKPERLSSKSLQKTLSPSTFAKKQTFITSNKLSSDCSKQKRCRMTQANLGRNIASAISPNNRKSISSKKSQRHTIHNLAERMMTEQSTRTMKQNHFDKYYL